MQGDQGREGWSGGGRERWRGVLCKRAMKTRRLNLGVVLRGIIAGARDGDWATNEASH